MIDTAQEVSALIDGDKHNQLKTRTDEKSKDYQEIKKMLQTFKKGNTDIKYIYTMRKTDQKDIWEFVVDAEDENSEDFSHLGDTYDVSELAEMKKAFDGSITDEQFKTNQWGTTLSGYTPIRDDSDNVVGIVGVDFEASSLVKMELVMLLGALAILIIVISITIFTTRKMIKNFILPFDQIMYGIKQITKGDLDYRLNIKTNDEFEEIGEALNSTADLLVDYHNILEEELKVAKEQKDNMFRVYRNVIYSITQGKISLLDKEEISAIADECILNKKMKVEKPEEVGEARQLIEDFMVEESLTAQSKTHIILCVSEAVTNVIKHAKRGEFQIGKLEDRIRILVEDNGPGMDLDKLPNIIFLNGFSTKVSMGYGFTIIYKFADKIYLSTSENGTFLVLDFLTTKKEQLPSEIKNIS